jgi:hypothetical protein
MKNGQKRRGSFILSKGKVHLLSVGGGDGTMEKSGEKVLNKTKNYWINQVRESCGFLLLKKDSRRSKMAREESEPSAAVDLFLNMFKGQNGRYLKQIFKEGKHSPRGEE